MSAMRCLIGGMILGLSSADACPAQEYGTDTRSPDVVEWENSFQSPGSGSYGATGAGGDATHWQEYQADVEEHRDGLQWNRIVVIVGVLVVLGVLRLAWGVVESMRARNGTGSEP